MEDIQLRIEEGVNPLQELENAQTGLDGPEKKELYQIGFDLLKYLSMRLSQDSD
jgi:hypothetical protein